MNESSTEKTEALPAPRLLALVATIPARKRSCARLLAELASQTRPPDGVVLVLDGYGDQEPPACSLPVVSTTRTEKPLGAGNRWRVVRDLVAVSKLQAEDVVVCVDDDTMLCEAPRLVQKLAQAVERSGLAAAAMGRDKDGKAAPPGLHSRGHLIYGAGCGLTARAGVLAGAVSFAEEVVARGGPDALGFLGDDDALVSAYLWKSGVTIEHVPVGNVYAAPGTRASSQSATKVERRQDIDAQKVGIARVTGWPWKVHGRQANAQR